GAQLRSLAGLGMPAEALQLGQTHWWPEVLAVLEGQANGASVEPGERFGVVRADTDGDSRIVHEVERLAGRPGASVTVVTSDRELRARVEALGAQTRGTGWLLEQLDALDG